MIKEQTYLNHNRQFNRTIEQFRKAQVNSIRSANQAIWISKEIQKMLKRSKVN